MKNNLVLILILTFTTLIDSIAQVDTAWVRRFNGLQNASDAGRIIKVAGNGFLYVGANVSVIPGYTSFALIKYNQNGDTLWCRYHNSPINHGSSLNDMTIDKSGSIILTGISEGTFYNDYATVKYDPDGNLIWARYFDDGDIDNAYAIVTDDLLNVYVTGSSWKVNQTDNIVTIKYNKDGDTLWTYHYNGYEDALAVGKDIVLDSQGNVFIAGIENYYWSVTKTDYIIIKCNSAGDTLWIRKYNSPQNGFDYLCAIAVDGSDNIYVTGYSYVAAGNYDIITIKYNNDGALIWDRIYNGPDNGDDVVYAMVVDSLGNVYLTGSSFVTGNGLDCLTIKYNSSGLLQWAKTYAEYSYYGDVANSLTLDKLGNVYVTGSAGTSSSNIAYLTLKYDNAGNEKWVTLYDGPGYNGYDITCSICVDDAGYIYITGSSAGLNSGSDVATIKYIQGPNSLDANLLDPISNFILEQNYPNPFNLSTTIKYTIPNVISTEGRNLNVLLRVYDILGNEVATLLDEEKPAGNYELEFNASNLSSGVYFYQVKAGEFIQTKKMILLK